jgi:hypothetical protein
LIESIICQPISIPIYRDNVFFIHQAIAGNNRPHQDYRELLAANIAVDTRGHRLTNASELIIAIKNWIWGRAES